MKRRIIWVLLLTMLVRPALADPGAHPLTERVTYDEVQTEHDFLNILLLGIDHLDYTLSGGMDKRNVDDNHTDAILLVAWDRTDNSVSLISIPRDTLVYIPGVYGVYKVNAAFNTATEMNDRLQRTCDTVGWLLGNVGIDHYIAVEPEAMVALGDAIGGLDFDLEMSYQGTERVYQKGYQHLDGVGIMDYMRARTNATVQADDLGRTGRQRAMLQAILEKIAGDPALAYRVLDCVLEQMDKTLFLNLSVADLLEILPMALTVDPKELRSYVLSGEKTRAMGYWDFNFPDQANRQEILKDVFGISADRLFWVSRGYVNWLKTDGFEAVRALRIAEGLLEYKVDGSKSAEQMALYDALLNAKQVLADAFSAVGDSLERKQRDLLTKRLTDLKLAAAAYGKAVDYPDRFGWSVGNTPWYEDPLINEYAEIDWR